MVPEIIEKKASEFASLVTENGCDVLIAIRGSLGEISTIEKHVHSNSAPICYRFSELVSCRTTMIDIALLLRDSFAEIAAIAKKKHTPDDIVVEEHIA